MPLLTIPVRTLSGDDTTVGELLAGRAALVVNVASRCGLTPQYAGLEALQSELGERGFTVLGVPCNQFAGQEPGSPEEIATFCSTTYGVSFPLTDKVEVNGPGRSPLYAQLTAAPDSEGQAGDVQWNSEKFVVTPDGAVAGRFRPRTDPHDPAVLETIERVLPHD